MIQLKHVESLSAEEEKLIQEYKNEQVKEQALQEEMDFILNHAKTTVQGNWMVSQSSPGYIGPNYQFNRPGQGLESFTWTFQVKKSDQYRVFVKYPPAFDRAVNAPFTVVHKEGRTLLPQNQRVGGNWELLGTFSFDAGVPGKIILSDKASGVVIADAIRIERVSEPRVKVVLDNQIKR